MFTWLKVWWHSKMLSREGRGRLGLEAAKALIELRAVEPLIQALGHKDHNVRYVAVFALQDLGAVEPLIKALGDADMSVRRAAAEALSELGDPRAVEPLFQTLGDKDPSVHWAAARALAQFGDPRAIEPLIKALGDADECVRRAAAQALGKLGEVKWEPLIRGDREDFARLGTSGDPRAVELLIKVLVDGDCHNRRAAAEGLGNLNNPRAIEPLISALGDYFDDVRQAAAEALGKLGEVKWEPLIRGDDEDFARLGTSGDPRAVDLLIKVLGHGNRLHRRAAAEGLGNLGNPRAIEPLISALVEPFDHVRQAAAKALGKLGEVKWEPLIRGDDEDFARLGTSGDPRAVEPLIKVLVHGDRLNRRAAAEALRSLVTGPSCAAIILSRWQRVHAFITTPHYDGNRYPGASDCTHIDVGIGLDFPPEPPTATGQKTDF